MVSDSRDDVPGDRSDAPDARDPSVPPTTPQTTWMPADGHVVDHSGPADGRPLEYAQVAPGYPDAAVDPASAYPQTAGYGQGAGYPQDAGYGQGAPYSQAPGYPPGYAPSPYSPGYAPSPYSPSSPYAPSPYGGLPASAGPWPTPPTAPPGAGSSPYDAPGLPPLPGRLAGWFPRVGAALIDSGIALLPLMVGYMVFGVGMGVAASTQPGGEPSGALVGVGFVGVLLGWAGYLWLWIWNRIVRQGRTGQSLGKKALNLYLVDEYSGRPVGAGTAFGRDVAHYLDGAVYIGYLWPLWDDKRQTFADKICRTVVISL